MSSCSGVAIVPDPVFTATGTPGYSSAILHAPGVLQVRKRARSVRVHFAAQACAVKTVEGMVQAQPGDAILTGVNGEQWPVPRASFDRRYVPEGETAAGADGRYRSLPLPALGVCMTRAFSVVLADGVSQLQGRAGDWLLDYGDGNLGVVAADIFMRTYDQLD